MKLLRRQPKKHFKTLLREPRQDWELTDNLKHEASTIAFRRRWAAFLAEDTSPAKSNLTATGQLLEALYYRVVGNRFFVKVNSKNRDEGLGGEELVSVKVTKKK